VSNLINMMERARYDVIFIADSDIAVEPDYLVKVSAPLNDPTVGVVTCLYRTLCVGGLWPRLGALFINEWFAPSVRVAHTIGSRRFGFGATLAIRRETLEHIGGFAALKNCLADDYWLADHVRALGLRTVLSPVMVATDVIEPTFTTLWQREIRWLRTIRSVNPWGFASLLITFPAPWFLVGAWLAMHFAIASRSSVHWLAALTMSASTLLGLAARIALHGRSARHTGTFWRDLPLLPLRDMLLPLQWVAPTVGSHVVWRGARVPVNHAIQTDRTAGIRAMEVAETAEGK
jgi:ceramide glucosyltransferase